jgi:hypothetical protein
VWEVGCAGGHRCGKRRTGVGRSAAVGGPRAVNNALLQPANPPTCSPVLKSEGVAVGVCLAQVAAGRRVRRDVVVLSNVVKAVLKQTCPVARVCVCVTCARGACLCWCYVSSAETDVYAWRVLVSGKHA